MTGYHAWMFPFIALMFHLPVFLRGRWSWRLESRILATIMLFWVIEDALWFLLNPAFGWSRFSAGNIPWHKHWWFGLPGLLDFDDHRHRSARVVVYCQRKEHGAGRTRRAF